MSESNLLQWLSDFLSENPRIQTMLKDHIMECDDRMDAEEIDDAIDEFLNNH